LIVERFPPFRIDPEKFAFIERFSSIKKSSTKKGKQSFKGWKIFIEIVFLSLGFFS
jgi:hypothetical protein